MALQDLQDFFDPSFHMPIMGKVYVVQSPDAATGVKLQRLFTMAASAKMGVALSPEDLASLELDDEEEVETYSLVLGSAYAEMVADKVPFEMVKHAGTTAMMWIGLSREAAEAYWSAGVGEARGPEPQDHKAPAKKKTTPTTRSGRPAASRASSKTKPTRAPRVTPSTS
jgi:hypothetical protein